VVTSKVGPALDASNKRWSFSLNFQGIDNRNPYNKIHTYLIPKNNNPLYLNNSKPIGFCNVTSNIISKTVSNRNKPILSKIISPTPECFIIGETCFWQLLWLLIFFTTLAKTIEGMVTWESKQIWPKLTTELNGLIWKLPWSLITL